MVTINIGPQYPRRRKRRYTRSRPRYRSFGASKYTDKGDTGDTGGYDGTGIPPGGIQPGWGWNPDKGYHRLPGHPDHGWSSAAVFGGGFTTGFWAPSWIF